VRQKPVELPDLQIVAAFVCHTDGESRLASFFRHGALVQEPLDLHLLSAYPVGVVPMDLGRADTAVQETHKPDPFELAPATAAVPRPKRVALTNRQVDCNRLDSGQRADQLEVHSRRLPRPRPNYKPGGYVRSAGFSPFEPSRAKARTTNHQSE